MVLSQEPEVTAGKLRASGVMERLPRKVHTTHTDVPIFPIVSVGGHYLSARINNADFSLLLDTGAVVTLLRQDTWLRATSSTSQTLRPWAFVNFISAGGTALTIHGCVTADLELDNKVYSSEVVVVSPLTSEGILGLNFLHEQNAMINLASKTLHMRENGHVMKLHVGDMKEARNSTPELYVCHAHAILAVRAIKSVTKDTVVCRFVQLRPLRCHPTLVCRPQPHLQLQWRASG